MVMDSLRYWVSEMRVDGFRFDLGTILAREPDGFKTESGFLKAVGQDPLLAEVKLIAEPWDCGPGGYQVGGFPPGWAEWNDAFRDAVRDFWRGEASAKALAPRLCASPDKFNFRGRRPWASVNFIAAHDGFTLRDLVSYNEKHNEANGEDNRDGHSDNRSWNCGAEGPTDDKAILALRWRQMRNLLATLLLSQGTPMVCAGDEFGRTQKRQQQRLLPGQRDQLGQLGDGRGQPALVAFFRRLTAAFHLYPVLRRSRFLTGEMNPDIDVKDVTWIDANGAEMTVEGLGQRLDALLRHAARRTRPGDGHQETRRGRHFLLIVFNAHHDIVEFTLPACYEADGWMLHLDTNDPALPATAFEVGIGLRSDRPLRLLLFERIPELVKKIEEAPEALRRIRRSPRSKSQHRERQRRQPNGRGPALSRGRPRKSIRSTALRATGPRASPVGQFPVPARQATLAPPGPRGAGRGNLTSSVPRSRRPNRLPRPSTLNGW